MSLETVAEEIRSEAEERAEAIRQQAEERAEEIVAEAEAEADEIVADAEAEVEQEIDQLREQELSSAKLEAKHERMSARREALDDVRDRVESRLTDLDAEKRRSLTDSLLTDSLAEFDEDEQLAVHYAPGDEALLEDLLDERPNVTTAGEYDCLGGVVVESETSRVRVKNTFDSVLEDVWENELKQISDRLFDDR
ncbi:V-type ATP synthase subunit E [Halarchaeum nitratireducens]|uniref:A-type ATP synthase subunit E n=1 Tax=Halarchaeum nitratireducens TaxID=489913 RepID=A0A830GAA7_9EURY|nr:MULTISPECIES: V-type ATP synthase subunit E [Halarchaeum]MBP2250292.1 V/A-type H+-transporting ATPase subunit E [Halarchaeum solikamskense]GGN12544.1 ATP synthase subunit E [Halarchaeum nitratireducens]